MRVWIVALRIIGSGLLLFCCLWGVAKYLTSLGNVFNDLYAFIFPITVFAVLGVLSFAAASALASLHRMEARIMRATSARSRARADGAQPKDLAPVAPNWPETKYAIRPARWEQRPRRMERMDDEFEQATLARRMSKREATKIVK